MSTAQNVREVKAAQNQLMFRHVNQRISELGGNVLNSVAELDFVCECDDQTCTNAIRLPLEEFIRLEHARNRFIVRPGHVDPAVEDVVAADGRYVVVAKRGAGAAYVHDHSES
jgi:hypothetical protein